MLGSLVLQGLPSSKEKYPKGGCFYCALCALRLGTALVSQASLVGTDQSTQNMPHQKDWVWTPLPNPCIKLAWQLQEPFRLGSQVILSVANTAPSLLFSLMEGEKVNEKHQKQILCTIQMLQMVGLVICIDWAPWLKTSTKIQPEVASNWKCQWAKSQLIAHGNC